MLSVALANNLLVCVLFQRDSFRCRLFAPLHKMRPTPLRRLLVQNDFVQIQEMREGQSLRSLKLPPSSGNTAQSSGIFLNSAFSAKIS
mmetsp:Transcript_10859/g.40524  ORF Transcript_10859/g.40524 Transcript_10859/m.40524 type:complete len:88 (-) Transcript_10859:123-386(-)